MDTFGIGAISPTHQISNPSDHSRIERDPATSVPVRVPRRHSHDGRLVDSAISVRPLFFECYDFPPFGMRLACRVLSQSNEGRPRLRRGAWQTTWGDLISVDAVSWEV